MKGLFNLKYMLAVLSVFAILIYSGSVFFPGMLADMSESHYTTGGILKTTYTPMNYVTYLLKTLFVQAAFIQPSDNVSPGDTVQFDSYLYMDCGVCGVPFNVQLDGYTIKVFQPNGNGGFNMVEEEQYYVDNLYCGDYGNVGYYYTVPNDATPGLWKIEVEIASNYNPYQPGCIVAQDEGYFTVGQTCDDYAEEVRFCSDDNQVSLYKPANSCNYESIECSRYGAGYKCNDVTGNCELMEVCGDGVCDDFESHSNCYVDCGFCGDHFCDEGYENKDTCPEDCSICGDGECYGSEVYWCGADCAVCGDGICQTYELEGEPYFCRADCGDSSCTLEGESPSFFKPCCPGLVPVNDICVVEKPHPDIFKTILISFVAGVGITILIGLLLFLIPYTRVIGRFIFTPMTFLIISVFMSVLMGLLFWNIAVSMASLVGVVM